MKRWACLLLLGCGDDGGPEQEPGCATPLLTVAEYTLKTCADYRSIGVEFRGATVLQDARPALATVDGPAQLSEWPTAAWQVLDNTATLRLSGHEVLPDLEWRLEVGEGVQLTAESSGDVTVVPLVTPTPASTGWLPLEPGPVVTTPVIRPVEQLFLGPVSLWIGGDTISVHTEANVRVEPRVAGPIASVSLAASDDGAKLLRDRTIREQTGPQPWGWRSARAYGPLINASVIQAQFDALARWDTDDLPAPWLVADGLWSTAIGEWRANDGFPDGLAALTQAIAPAQLALRWPALLVTEDAARYAEHPEWRDPDRDCGAQCAVLDPEIPAVRDALARDLSTLVEDGVSGVFVAGLARSDAALISTLSGVAPTFSESGPVAQSLGLVALDFSPRAACPSAPGPTTETCALAIRELRPDDIATTEVTPVETLAFRLAQYGHRAAAIDLGPIELLGRSPGEQRQALALAALAGGPYLLADDLVGWDAGLVDVALAPLHAGDLRGFPTTLGGEEPPAVWTGERVVAWFNWGDETQGFGALDSQYRAVWGPGSTDVPPGDVMLWVR